MILGLGRLSDAERWSIHSFLMQRQNNTFSHHPLTIIACLSILSRVTGKDCDGSVRFHTCFSSASVNDDFGNKGERVCGNEKPAEVGCGQILNGLHDGCWAGLRLAFSCSFFLLFFRMKAEVVHEFDVVASPHIAWRNI